MRIRTIRELDVKGKTALVRAGFDVPVASGRVKDDLRIKSSLPTLEYLAARGAKIVIVSHLGRPRGRDESMTLAPAAARLGELMGRKTIFLDADSATLPDYDIPHIYFLKHDLARGGAAALIRQMRAGDIAVLENLRFYEGERAADADFAEKLAALGDVYINDAFSACHRPDASIALLPALLPSAAGLDLVREVAALEQVVNHPKKPIVVMMGGVKIESKAAAIKHLAKMSGAVLLGGGLANTMFKARGYEIGKSARSDSQLGLARQLLRDFKDTIKLPIDVVVSISSTGRPELVAPDKVKSHQMILDIGPRTIAAFSSFLRGGRTLIWNGPLGHFEQKQFSHGTYALARLFAARSAGAAFGVAGGGETLEVIKNENLASQIGHVSTGGGAMLDFLAGAKLPGLEALRT